MRTQQVVKLILKSFDHKILDSSVKDIVHIVRKAGDQLMGPIPLPTKFKRFTVNRSTHVNKKSREQFEIRAHKRLLMIMSPSSEAIEALMKLDLASGVDVQIKLMGAE